VPNGPRIVVTADHTDDSWMADAACRGHQDIFWPAVPHHSTYLQATRICATCPVIDDCGDYADRLHLEGVWGGRHRWGTSKRGPG
jgi:hypothetical protein